MWKVQQSKDFGILADLGRQGLCQTVETYQLIVFKSHSVLSRFVLHCLFVMLVLKLDSCIDVVTLGGGLIVVCS